MVIRCARLSYALKKKKFFLLARVVGQLIRDHEPRWCNAPLEVFGDVYFGKVRLIKPTQLAFRRTISVYLLTYLFGIKSLSLTIPY